MTLLIFDGFDRYSDDTELPDYGVPWTNTVTTAISTTVPRGAGNSLDLNNSNAYLTLSEFGGETYIVGFHYRIEIFDTGTDPILCITTASSGSLSIDTQLSILLNSTSKKIEVRRGHTAGTLLATGAVELIVDEWYYIEFKFKVHSSTGIYAVKLNGIEDIAEQTSQNTQNEISNSCLRLQFGETSQVRIDNLYVLDTVATPNNTYLGEVDIKMLDVTGDNSVAWTKSGGANNYILVDDPNPHDSDTTYVETDVATTKDLFDLENSGTTDSIYSVKLVTVARKTDTAAREIDTIISVSATEQTNTKSLVSTYTAFIDYYDTSDGGTTAWTNTTLDSALTGFELTT